VSTKEPIAAPCWLLSTPPLLIVSKPGPKPPIPVKPFGLHPVPRTPS
jgi:hypothetical protein